MERITPNGHRVVTYNPRRYCKRTLFNRVLKELKARVPKPINWFNIVLIELKEKMKNRPTYFVRGKMYNYKWVLPTHRRIQKYYKNEKGRTIYQIDKLEFIKRLLNKCPVMEYVLDTFSTQINNKDGKWREMNEEELKQYINKNWFNHHGGLEIDTTMCECVCHRDVNVPKFKIRFEIGKMDLTKTPISRYSVLNLKWWDKKTKKTSNKGLKADTTYSWGDGYSRGGWTFGGLQADTLKILYKQNGMTPSKGLQYGDYAEWYLKLM